MKKVMEKPGLPSDPRAVLGVAPDATDEQIRAAYLRKVKEFPPDRNPVEFEQVRDAYELLRDRRQLRPGVAAVARELQVFLRAWDLVCHPHAPFLLLVASNRL